MYGADTYRRVVYGEGAQPVRTIPLDDLGQPVVVTSPTYTIVRWWLAEDDSNRYIQGDASTPASATVDSVNTTISAAAGPSTAQQLQLTVASGTGITAGHTYVLQNSSTGVKEEVLVDAVSGTTVTMSAMLTREFPSGSTFKGCEVTGTFPALVANDEEEIQAGSRPFRVRWEWTVDSRTRIVWEPIWLTRTSLNLFVSVADLKRVCPTLADRTGQRIKLEDCIVTAHEWFYNLLRAARLDPDTFYSPEYGRAIIQRYGVYCALRTMRGEKDDAMREEYRDEAQSMANTLLNGQTPTGTVRPDSKTDTAKGSQDRSYISEIFINT